jgi:hypothetical protein
VQNEILKIMVLVGSDGATFGKNIFTYAHIGKKIFSKTNMPVSIKLDANYPFMKATQVCLVKGTDPHQREIL